MPALQAIEKFERQHTNIRLLLLLFVKYSGVAQLVVANDSRSEQKQQASRQESGSDGSARPPSFFPRLASTRRTAPPTEGLEQATG